MINDAPLSNHLGRLELTPTAGGTHLDYTIDFDYRPAFLGPVVAGVLKTTWAAPRAPASCGPRSSKPQRYWPTLMPTLVAFMSPSSRISVAASAAAA